jgi:gamma-glutamylcyclotransferase (GGCT)/AIG2-like uncharacterized protein YtfP
MKMNKTIYLAVYGTLKKGFHNHKLLMEAKFIEKGQTKEKYLLTTIGGMPIPSKKNENEKFQKFEKKHLELTPFPYVFENKKEYAIEVEIYEITEEILKHCDKLESVPYFYYRKQVEVILEGKTINAEMYFIRQ